MKFKTMTLGSIVQDARTDCKYLVINLDPDKEKWQGLSYHGGRFFLSLPSLSTTDPNYKIIGYVDLEDLKFQLYS